MQENAHEFVILSGAHRIGFFYTQPTNRLPVAGRIGNVTRQDP